MKVYQNYVHDVFFNGPPQFNCIIQPFLQVDRKDYVSWSNLRFNSRYDAFIQ